MQLQGTFKVKVTKTFSKLQWIDFIPDSTFIRGNYSYNNPEISKLDISSVSEPELGSTTLFLPGGSISRDFIIAGRDHYHMWDYAIQAYKILKYCMPSVQIIDWDTEEELKEEDMLTFCYACRSTAVISQAHANGRDRVIRCTSCAYSFSECASCNNTYTSMRGCNICNLERECAFCGEYKLYSKKYIENSTGCDYYLCEDCNSKDITTAAKLRYDFKTTFTYRRFLNESVVNAISSRKRVSKSSFKFSRDTENTPTQQQIRSSITGCDSELGQQVTVPSWDFRPSAMWYANPCAESPSISESSEQQAEVPTTSSISWDEEYRYSLDRCCEQLYAATVASGRIQSVLPDEPNRPRRSGNSSGTITGRIS